MENKQITDVVEKEVIKQLEGKTGMNRDLVLFWVLVIIFTAMTLFSFVGVLYLLLK